jgi:SOS-response transcriptional repressor LexA
MDKLKHSLNLSSRHYLIQKERKRIYPKAMLKHQKKPPTPEQIAIGRRIKEAIESLGRGGKSYISKKAINQKGEIGIAEQSVTGWIKNGRISKENLLILEKETGYSTEWMLSGKGAKFTSDYKEKPNIEPGPDIRGSVPLISWVRAGSWCEAIDLYEPGDADHWLPCPVAHGPHTYCLRIKGDSMTNTTPGQRSYPEGMIIFVDPDRPVTNGCRVIAKLPDCEEVTFKEYREDSGKRFLMPLNRQYDKFEITEDTRLCGVVIFAGWQE